ncbi:MAG: glycosyltransferase family 9 protein [Synergistaceae bacterium]|jgi:ADP-heptose:LPS heptosyltransferase|nr:glycosyltransferase family 9 protein [Synergistaceae bacterium]
MSTIHPQPGDKVLWIRFGAFGDVLQAAAAAHRFKMKYPGVRLTFLTQPDYAGILKIQPYIDGLLSWDITRYPLDFFGVVRQIRAAGFKWLFSLHRGGGSAFVALCGGIPQRFGYNRMMQFCYKATHWEGLHLLGVEFMKRDKTSIFAAPEDKNKARAMLSGLPDKKFFAVIGAGKPHKIWPAQNWIEFLPRLLAEGWGIVLNGHGEAEARIAREIEEALRNPAVRNLVGQVPFPLMAAVAEACTVAAGNDTGPLHLAALSGVPTMGLFNHRTSQIMGLRMPWFRELCAEDWSGGGKSGIPLENLPAESVVRAFDAFAGEFLPRAFAWRDKAATDASLSFLQNLKSEELQ